MRESWVPNALPVQRTKAKMLPGAKKEDAPLTIDDLFVDGMAEANPALDAAFVPHQFDLRECVHDCALSATRPSGIAGRDGSVALCRQHRADAWIGGR